MAPASPAPTISTRSEALLPPPCCSCCSSGAFRALLRRHDSPSGSRKPGARSSGAVVTRRVRAPIRRLNPPLMSSGIETSTSGTVVVSLRAAAAVSALTRTSLVPPQGPTWSPGIDANPESPGTSPSACATSSAVSCATGTSTVRTSQGSNGKSLCRTKSSRGFFADVSR